MAIKQKQGHRTVTLRLITQNFKERSARLKNPKASLQDHLPPAFEVLDICPF